MNNYYITFGQVHTHSIDGKTIDKDCVVEIQAPDEGAARALAFETFGPKWAFIYDRPQSRKFYPRGIVLTLTTEGQL